MITIKTKGTFNAEQAVHFLDGKELFCFLSIPWVNGYTQNSDRSENIIAIFEMGCNKSNNVTQDFIGVSVSYFDSIQFSFLDSKFNAYNFCCSDEQIIFMLCFKPFI